MLVTTPEKWDVVTRKSVGDVALSQIVKLLILDEVHLLHEDRGPVLESIVARTLRQVRGSYGFHSLTALCLTLPRQLPPTYIPVLFIKGKCLNFFSLPKRHPASSFTISILAVFAPFLSSPCPSFPGYHSFHSVNCSFLVLCLNFSFSGDTFS